MKTILKHNYNYDYNYNIYIDGEDVYEYTKDLISIAPLQYLSNDYCNLYHHINHFSISGISNLSDLIEGIEKLEVKGK